MSEFTISIEGPNAISLAKGLEKLTNFKVDIDLADPTEDLRGDRIDRVLVKLTLLVTLATGTVGLASKTVDLVDKVVNVIERVQEVQVPPVVPILIATSVLIVSNKGERKKLTNPTLEQIIEVLKEME
jgi:hypothetical protein